MMHQRHKARAIMSKGSPSIPMPPLPSVPDMGTMNAQPPMPSGISDPSLIQQDPSGGGAPGGAPSFRRGGVVK